jgi:hypothetical protein
MRNLKRAFATNILLASVLGFLSSGSMVAQEPQDNGSEVVYEVGLGSDVKPPKAVYQPTRSMSTKHAGRRSTVSSYSL